MNKKIIKYANNHNNGWIALPLNYNIVAEGKSEEDTSTGCYIRYVCGSSSGVLPIDISSIGAETAEKCQTEDSRVVAGVIYELI